MSCITKGLPELWVFDSLWAISSTSFAKALRQVLVWDHDGTEDSEDTTVSSMFEAVDKDDDVRKERGLAPVKDKGKKDKKSKGKKKKSSTSSSSSSSSSTRSSSDTEDSSEVYASKCFSYLEDTVIWIELQQGW